MLHLRLLWWCQRVALESRRSPPDQQCSKEERSVHHSRCREECWYCGIRNASDECSGKKSIRLGAHRAIARSLRRTRTCRWIHCARVNCHRCRTSSSGRTHCCVAAKPCKVCAGKASSQRKFMRSRGWLRVPSQLSGPRHSMKPHLQNITRRMETAARTGMAASDRVRAGSSRRWRRPELSSSEKASRIDQKRSPLYKVW